MSFTLSILDRRRGINRKPKSLVELFKIVLWQCPIVNVWI